MELQSFELVWLARPVEECPSGEGLIEGREAELRIDGPEPVAYAVWLGYCADDAQWYGLQEMLDEILADEGWTYDEIEGFAIDGSPVTTGVQLGFQKKAISWEHFREQTAEVASRREAPPPSAEAVRALERRPTTWELAWRPVGWARESEEPAVLLYAALVHDAAGYLRTASLYPGRPPTAEQLEELVRRAAGAPDAPGVPIRPASLHLADAAAAEDLAGTLAPLGIRVEAAATPQADDALDQLVDHLTPDLPPAFLSDAGEDEVRAFFETAADFYAAQPWRRIEGDKYLGLRFNDGPWHYASVMGQLDEAPGLALFDDWLQLCRFHHNQPSFFADVLGDLTGEPPPLSSIDAAGAAEAVTLDELVLLHPADAAYVQALGIEPLRDDLYPIPYRYDIEAGHVAPHFSLADYRALMRALLLALERRRATPVTSIKTTLAVAAREVTLRYPADGTERALDGPRHARLVVEGWEDAYGPGAVPPGRRLHVDAPGAAPFYEVGRAIERFDEALRCTGVGAGDVVLWNARMRRTSPCPRVADLAACADLWIELSYETRPLTLRPHPGPPPEEIRVELAKT